MIHAMPRPSPLITMGVRTVVTLASTSLHAALPADMSAHGGTSLACVGHWPAGMATSWLLEGNTPNRFLLAELERLLRF
jgi:hypothetical protein